MKQRLSATLELAGHRICCRACGRALGEQGHPWKTRASLREMPLDDSSKPPDRDSIVLREFSCPRCGAVLDVETALRSDPFLDDIVLPRATP
jgi:acetone carboxylase gamma subunit